MRPKRVALKHHPRIPLVGRKVGHIAITHPDRPLFGNIEARQATQQRRLSATARSEQKEELARLDRQADLIDDRQVAKPLGDVFEMDFNRHAEARSMENDGCRAANDDANRRPLR